VAWPGAASNFHRAAGQALPLEQVLELGAKIADALEVPHEKGIVHRDIKPANIEGRFNFGGIGCSY
jgi:eukaryotic-like serine/threonine-protein kinase